MKLHGSLRLLAKDDLYAIHQASLGILENPGFRIEHEGLLKTMNGMGAEVDYKGMVVRFPGELVEEALAKQPRPVVKPGEKLGCGSGGYSLGYMPIGDRRRRRATLGDLAEIVRLSDALKNVSPGIGVTPWDVPLQVRDLVAHKVLWENSGLTPCNGVGNVWSTPETLPHLYGLLEEIFGGEEVVKRRLLTLEFDPIDPLRFPWFKCEMMVFAAERGQRVACGAIVMGGTTAPATLAAMLVQQNADNLAALTLAWSVNPEVRFSFSNSAHIADPITGKCAYGSPESALMALAGIQMMNYYGFEVGANTFLTTEKLPGPQAAAEKALNALVAGLGGASGVGSAGLLSVDEVMSPAQLIIDSEIMGLVNRILRGFSIGREELALEVIREVGIGGMFLTHPHTSKMLRKEFWLTDIFDRGPYDLWLKDEGVSVVKGAEEKAERLLREHQPEGLEKDILKTVENYIKGIIKCQG